MTDFDVAIIGSGIAGASLASQLAGAARLLLLEAESQPGYHATGRSAAFWTESYGGPMVQPLTSASGPFLSAPPPDISDQPFMHPRGALHIGREADRTLASKLLADFAPSGVSITPVSAAEIARRVGHIQSDWTIGLWEPDCCDIDVGGLHSAYLRAAKRKGAKLACNAALRRAEFGNGRWALETAAGNFTAKAIVNAAGAWADQVAERCDIRPIGITAYRRTVLQLQTDPGFAANLPLVIALDGSFYFKPEAGGRIWLSPHDETPSPPCDAAPEEMDIAIAMDRFQQVTNCAQIKLERKWAGLRSFARDRLPVIGADPECSAFFWLAGQGGFGIQTAPATAQLAASLLSGNITAPAHVDPAHYAPDRFR
ncbi:NAD(P)/FAD-dependent oxidoreductase [Sphingorhabdus arenilitoris]|uniref:NAD(P)/FAD-dependent oxidoreductase n=1 Tax=Sphingorhabdus arenilitoris TaxID=1490041 RepID=A0ABV8RGE9_9SPHN